MDQVYCNTCGAENPVGTVRCSSCGELLPQAAQNGSYQQPYPQPYQQPYQQAYPQSYQQPYQQSYQQPYQQPYVSYPVPDAPSGGMAVLGFFFPMIGLILYLTSKDTTPLKAKSAGKGALIGAIIWFVIGVILPVVITILGAALY